MALLEVSDLNVGYAHGAGHRYAVRGVDLSVARGEILGIAGESGSGKSTLALSLLRLLPPGADVSGQVLLDGEELTTAKWSRIRAVRWDKGSVVFQGAMNALNPVRTIEEQIAEPIVLHDRVAEKVARARARELLDRVGVPSRRASAYPHELSGGQRQRVMIAMALACRPDLLIADEPTTALDVIVQAQILELLEELVRESQIAVIMISHDLAVLAELCTRLAVMYAGRLVEIGPAAEVFADPAHPYTGALSQAFPIIGDPSSRRAPAGLPGDPPPLGGTASGCSFAPRCPRVADDCRTQEVELRTVDLHRQAACLHIPALAATSPGTTRSH